tara:strand:- start:633 stop:2522 length:1890 start_codon:yes stop_codon:yes gene_type:complete
MKPSSGTAIHRSLLLLFAVGLVCAVWIVLPLPSLTFVLPKLLLLTFVTVAVVASLLLEPSQGIVGRLLSQKVGKWFLLFVLIIPLSLLWSVAPLLSFFGASPRFEGVLTHMLYMSIAIIGLLSASTKEGRRIIIKTIVVANTSVVLYGLLQVLSLDPLAFLWGSDVFLGRTFSVLGQPNTLGLFIVLTLPFVILLGQISSLKWRRAMLALFLLNVVVLLSTVSRSAILGLGVAFLFVPFWMRGRFLPCSKKQWSASIACALALVALGAYYSSERFSVPTEAGRSVNARSLIWQGSAQMIAARPMGYGLETVGILSARNFSNQLLQFESLTTRIDRAHSKPLDLLITLGPLGLLAYYALVITLLRLLWRKRREEGMHLYYLAGFLSILGASITLLFGFDVLITASFFWLIVGMMLAPLLPDVSSSRWDRPFLLLLSLSLVVLLVTSGQWVRSRVSMEKAEQWFTSGNLAQAVYGYAEAVDAFRFDRHLLTQAAETNLFALEQAENEETSAALKNLIEQQLTQLEELTGGEDGMALLLRAWGKAIEGERDSVDWLLLQAAMKQPAGVIHYRIALHCYALLDDREQVENIYDLLIELLPPAWMQPETDQGRIIWKEHPWLEPVLEYAESRNV